MVPRSNFSIALLPSTLRTGDGSGGGVVQSAGTVTAVSTLVGDNGAVDYSGSVTATDRLFQTAPTGTLSGSGNIVGKDPLLAPTGSRTMAGLPRPSPCRPPAQPSTRGPTPRTSSLINADSPRGPERSGTDIGAYQHDAQSDTQAPTATFQAVVGDRVRMPRPSIPTHSRSHSRTTLRSRSQVCRARSFKSFLLLQARPCYRNRREHRRRGHD